jgi:hypothetical protein
MNVHVLPRDDERPHQRTATCWCNPHVDWIDPDTGMPWASGGCRVIHNAADCREVVEWATRERYGGWEVLMGDAA